MIRQPLAPAILPAVIAPRGDIPGPMMNVIPARNQLAALFVDRDGVMTDIIGLSVADYNLVDPLYQSIFFIDSGTLRPTADAYALALASPLLNLGTMIGSATKNIVVLYQYGTSYEILDRALRYVNLTYDPLNTDINTSALNDTPGTHTGALWLQDEDGVYRQTASGNPNLKGAKWDAVNSLWLAPTTYPTRGIRTGKGTRYPTTDVNFRGLSCSPAMTNKVTCRKTNPTNTSNLTKTGDAAAVLSVVDDTAALVAAGLSSICASGKVYDVDNTSGLSSSLIAISGAVSNTNKHSGSVFARRVSSSDIIKVGYSATAGTEFGEVTSATYVMTKGENTTPPTTNSTLLIVVRAGVRARFILPELIEASFIGHPAVPSNAAADGLATYTRPATYATYSTTDLLPMTDATHAQNFAIAMRIVPLKAGQSSAWMLSSYVDANNYTGILTTATQAILRKRVASVDTDAIITYTHAANTPFWITTTLSDQGMSAKIKQDGGVWSDWSDVTTSAGKAASPVAATYQIGALNNTAGFAAYYPIGPQIIDLGSQDTLDDYKAVVEAKLAEILI